MHELFRPLGANLATRRRVTDRVLIVEDDWAIRELVDNVLRRAGFQTKTAPNGTEAIAALRDQQFSAIVLDLMMPGITGYDLIMHMRANHVAVPVVVLTAAVKSLQEALLDPAIVKSVVTKPFELPALEAAVRQACASRA
jgi:DNA-binding response OmpR family regulator